jgi:riboflavin kinase
MYFQETHILHNFNRDLYGCILKVCIVGYLRPEKNFDSLDSLIEAIQKDISDTQELLESPEFLKFKTHEFFSASESSSSNGQNGHHVNGHI